MNESADRLYAELYDALGVGWPGELGFYHELAAATTARGERVLEVGCGTGRIALSLAQAGAAVTGFDISPEMVAVARRKGRDITSARWIVADMRSFDLVEVFGLIIIPAHSFQFMLTPDDQLACLTSVRQHLTPGGRFAVHLDHQDLAWLGSLPAKPTGAFERARKVVHPETGGIFGQTFSWSYERATQTATVVSAWEELDATDTVISRWEQMPRRLHCAFRSEVEHLLARAGLAVEALYGDFARRALDDDSPEMIWVARSV